MKKRELGKSGLFVRPLGLGTNVFGWTTDESTGFTLLDRISEHGDALIDTADYYSRWVDGNQGGESESLIGRWLKRTGKRNKIFLATKVGLDMGAGGKGLSRKHILKSIEGSLRRLGTEYVDLYQSHTDDLATDMEETLSTYAELIKAGKVRAIGASNFSANRLAEALSVSKKLKLPRYETLQPKYNLCERKDYEAELAALCKTESISVIPYYPLASGFLTGKYRSEADLKKSTRGEGVAKYLRGKGKNILNALDTIASENRATPAQVALAWLMHKAEVAAPIASATSLEQLNELLPAMELNLSEAELNLLDEVSK